MRGVEDREFDKLIDDMTEGFYAYSAAAAPAAVATEKLGDEMADVLFVLICLANQTGIDLEQAIAEDFNGCLHIPLS
jgi:NTP pyrophosphatase (non-canonical NTP hydrolase)